MDLKMVSYDKNIKNLSFRDAVVLVHDNNVK